MPSTLGRESATPARTREGAGERSPAIAGPSFLGLSSAGYSADPSYLLDEEESSSHLGLWIFLVLMVAAVGTGFHFRNELRVRANQAYAAIVERVNPQPEAPAQSPAAVPQSDPHTGSPSIDTETSKEAQPASPATAADNGNPPHRGAAESPKTSDTGKNAEESDSKGSAEAEKSAAELGSKPDREEETKPTRKAAARQSSAKRREAPPEDTRLLQLARRYIHGQGVPRNCEQGLSYLRQAVKRPNSEAASQMGALYATGTCVPQDRLAAYRWFSTALQMDPDNSWLSRERDELYGQMSSAERRQADR